MEGSTVGGAGSTRRIASMTDILDPKVVKKAATLPNEVRVLGPDGNPLDDDGEECVVFLDAITKLYLADRMIAWKQSFDVVFKRHLMSAMKNLSQSTEKGESVE